MTKKEVICKNLQKNWIFGKNGHFLTVFGQKSHQFWIFLRVPLPRHASRHLGKDFRTFSAKTNDKNWSYQSKPSKNWIFGKNGHFLTVFGQKWPIFEFFSKICMGHFFYIAKALPNCKVSEKTNERILTYVRTSIKWIIKCKLFIPKCFLSYIPYQL